MSSRAAKSAFQILKQEYIINVYRADSGTEENKIKDARARAGAGALSSSRTRIPICIIAFVDVHCQMTDTIVNSLNIL